MKDSLEYGKVGSKDSGLYRSGYRGIWFNMMLLILVFISSHFLYDRAIAVIKKEQTDWLLGTILIIAMLLEIYLYPIKLRDIFSKHHYENRQKLKTLAFILLFLGGMLNIVGMVIVAMAFGFPLTQTVPIVFVIQFIRFLYLFFVSPITGPKDYKGEDSIKQVLKVDIGIAFFSSIYYVCIWQAMILSNYNLDRFNGESQNATFEVIGFALLVLLYILPMRALYFMEEWQGKPGIAGIFAIIFSLILLITETLFQFLSPAILNNIN